MTIKEWAAIAVILLLGASASLLLYWPPESGADIAAWAQAISSAPPHHEITRDN